MKLLDVRKKTILCDGCSEVGAIKKLRFNDDDDMVYMCAKCFEKLIREVDQYRRSEGE